MAEFPIPDIQDFNYGAHERQRLNLWRGPNKISPLVMYVHGGGWTGGDSANDLHLLPYFRERGFAYASITYRLTPTHTLPAPVADAARALQTIRHHANDFGIDPSRVGIHGWSAGGCSCLCLAMGPDFRDETSTDPIARQSSVPTCVAVRNAQASIDPPQVLKWVGDAVLDHRMIRMAVGEEDKESLLKNYEQHKALLQRFSPEQLISKERPTPAFLEYSDYKSVETPGEAIHHQIHGYRFKEKMGSLEIPCEVRVWEDDFPGVTQSGDFFTEYLSD